MTRKDFVLIARAVADARNVSVDPQHLGAVDTVALELADALRSTNPNFDRERFLRACRGAK
jgi:hypothetical protein